MKSKKQQKTATKKSIAKPENKQVAKRLSTTPEIKDKAFYYYAKGLTAKEVGKLLDIPFRTVQNWQTDEKWTEKLNPNSLKEKCFELKNKGLSYKELSEMLKISISSVQRYVSEVKNMDKTKNLK